MREGEGHRPDLSIVIVSWNVRELLRDCLASVFRSAGGLDLEVWVVDNASSDGSMDMIQHDFPQVKLLRNSENLGFIRATNLGLRASTGRHMLALNPDTLILDDAVERLVAFMDQHSEAGAVGPLIFEGDGKTIQWTCARALPTPLDVFLDFLRLNRLLSWHPVFGRLNMTYWGHDILREVDCLSGACMMVRGEVAQQVGVMDENYFMYWDDTDWSHRIRKGGWKVYFNPEAKIIHYGGGGNSQRGGQPIVEYVESAYKYFHKFHGPAAASSLRRYMVLAALIRIMGWIAVGAIKGSRRAEASDKMRAYWRICRLRSYPHRPLRGERAG